MGVATRHGAGVAIERCRHAGDDRDAGTLTVEGTAAFGVPGDDGGACLRRTSNVWRRRVLAAASTGPFRSSPQPAVEGHPAGVATAAGKRPHIQ